MKLYYRGASYEYEPTKFATRKLEQPLQPVCQSGTAYNLIYRGVNYRVEPNPISVAIPLAATDKLIYRGIQYLVNRNVQGEVTLLTESANPLPVGTQPHLTT